LSAVPVRDHRSPAFSLIGGTTPATRFWPQFGGILRSVPRQTGAIGALLAPGDFPPGSTTPLFLSDDASWTLWLSWSRRRLRGSPAPAAGDASPERIPTAQGRTARSAPLRRLRPDGSAASPPTAGTSCER